MQIFIVTGISGAGKTVFIKELEDNGFYCADNLPVPLLTDFISLIKSRDVNSKVAVGIDVREKDFLENLKSSIKNIKSINKEIKLKIIYLDAKNSVVIRRYNETRRKHPISSKDLENSIEQEKIMLSFIKKSADIVIDTSNLTIYELRKKVKNIITGKTDRLRMSIKIVSFGYKHGIPLDSDIVFDVRFIKNPYYVTKLKDKTGNDKEVINFLNKQIESKSFIAICNELLQTIIPNFDREGKNSLNICFGCTGGRHRSVYIANEMYKLLATKYKDISINHRDIFQ